MEHSAIHGNRILFKFLHGFFLSFIITGLESAALATNRLGNESDRLALLDFKTRITRDPLHIMSSWNDSISFCSWIGVTCNHSNRRVLILDLEAKKLAGSLSPSVGNLTFLTGINLKHNSFHGEIPQEMGYLQSLQHLNISFNSFDGKIPTYISRCMKLRVLDVVSNKITGSIPNQLSSLSKLTHLWLQGNNFTGTIPAWIANFSSLHSLALAINNFEGSIPNELGRLTSLEQFAVGDNNLSGTIPSSIYNISSIYFFGVAENQLHGELPTNVGFSHMNLQVFAGAYNKFSGTIPISFSNASRLQKLDLQENYLTGTVPAKYLASLQSLVLLNFEINRLGSGKNGDLSFLSYLANCTNLEMLGLYGNRFGGELPGSIANLSTRLKNLNLGANLLHGSVPNGIENLVSLTKLALNRNVLSGSLPRGIGMLQKLEGLWLSANKFSGPLPSFLGNLTSMTTFYLQENMFKGSIPASLANCQNLLKLNLYANNLTGTIPKDLLGLSSLISLNMSNNDLTGLLPAEVGELVNLVEIDVSRNKLTGEIPKALGSCIMLEHLNLEGNEFEGTIPVTFENLKSLHEIDISWNSLSGKIPEFLGNLKYLQHLNLSHNDFDGELPKQGIFSTASGLSVLGNDQLCGGIPDLHLPACPSQKTHLSRGVLSPQVIIPIVCALGFIAALSCFIIACSMVKKWRGRTTTSSSFKDWKSGLSYLELVKATNGFSVDNLVGSGSFGYVYKGVIPSDGTIVAVKVLNLQQQGASKSFIDECKALRSIRHRNLLMIITACSSIDNQGNDFKSLIFEYMENGNLDFWLYPKEDEESQSKRLSLVERLNIAIDVASALDYLHHGCETSVVHCDLKPSNVLLDGDMVAHVGDFGLAKFLLEASNDPSESQTISAGLKGSIGYIPPEYGMGGQVSTLGDIYSYGILLLEMFIGKRPTDDRFMGDQSIQQFPATAFPDHVMDIVDPTLLLERDDARLDDERHRQERPITKYHDHGLVQEGRLEECLVNVMEMGLSCSAISPTERIQMDVVVHKLTAIRDRHLRLRS